jgi:NAD(P)-dependent dehydrogenase (short-subunit alcohol dehydrogenase family)
MPAGRSVRGPADGNKGTNIVDTSKGKVVVVTGGANGLGFGLAEAFAEEGAKVVLADVDGERLEVSVGVLRDRGVEAIGVSTDVADARAVERMRDATFEAFGTAHVLCNNAGIGARSLLTEPIDVEPWRRVFDVDVFAILHGMNAFLPRMLEQGEGHIVNTSSRQGLVAAPHLGPYPPAKHASVALTEMLAAELAELGSPVGATVLTPGGVLTGPILEAHRRHQDGEADDPVMKDFLATRVALAVEPIEVGRLVVRAVRERRLYVNTHRETIDWLRARVDRMAADADALGTLR